MNVVALIDVGMMLEYNVFWMVAKEHILSMFNTLHTKCLIKCPNENYIDYWVSVGYGNDVNCSLIKCILN